MDAIKKKMEKLANETNDAETRIAHFEDIKAANELEAEKYEEQLKNVQKKIQASLYRHSPALGLADFQQL